MASETSTVNRDYIDNFSVKDYTTNNLVLKYFSDFDPSLRTVGMIGYTTEIVTNYGEDVFNTGSVLFRETFPNRAQIPESIYSHAAIFQLDNIFSTAANCKFLLVMEEAAIIKNMVNDYDADTGVYHFYIDKNTTIYVEDLPYVLDYEIRLDVVKKVTKNGEDYLFTAKYETTPYTNSISDIKDPYVKIRRSSDGYIALEVQCHQCVREVRYETLASSSIINFPVIDIEFTGKLAGFDVLYKSPTSNEQIQLEKRIIYSQATKNPFCYYQMYDEDTLRLSFNSKDTYFIPDFNSDLEITLYITEGADGNFDSYTGDDIALVPDNETHQYGNTYLTAAKPVGASADGGSQMSLDALQSLAVEGYRTATALTTENDLNEYFNNYKYRYGDINLLFIKKRNDVAERVFSAFILMRNGDYIYNTNTLRIHMNLSDMRNPEKDIYMLDPGFLFTANKDDGYAEFWRDQEKTNQYYADYQQAIKDGTIPYVEGTDPSTLPAYLNRPASFAEYKRRNGLDDKVSVFDCAWEDLEDSDYPNEWRFLLINPFLIRFKKSPNLVSTYMTYVMNTSVVDFTNANDPTDTDPGAYVQFILHIFNLQRAFSSKKLYTFNTNIGPSISVDAQYPVIATKTVTVIDPDTETEKKETQYILGDKYVVADNDLRVILLIKDNVKNICFTELTPTEFNNMNFKFEGSFETDDHITSDGYLRILSGEIFRDKTTGEYYKVQEHNNAFYNKYDSNDNIISRDIPVDDVTALINSGKLYKWTNVHNMTAKADILIPMTDVECEIWTLYHRRYDKEDGSLVVIPDDQGSNIFEKFDESLKGYIWTNQYTTGSEPITFMQPLESVRTYLTFNDYTEVVQDPETKENKFTHDIMDVELNHVSFLRAQTVFNEEKLNYFMSTFFNQYKHLTDIIQTRLRNCTNLDVKFYNTYGRSKYFLIGEEGVNLDTVNLSLDFDVWYAPGTDVSIATPELKSFIKENVESINENGMNNLFISNLMRKIENTYAYVDHIRFNHINAFDTEFQAVINYKEDINELSVEERRNFVPEFLVADTNDIHITEYFAGQKTV